MDPTACWQRMLDAMAEGDADELLAAFEDLTEWLAKGGHKPEQWTDEMTLAAITDDTPPCTGCTACDIPEHAYSPCMVQGGRDGREWCNRPRGHFECGRPHSFDLELPGFQEAEHKAKLGKLDVNRKTFDVLNVGGIKDVTVLHGHGDDDEEG